ncbi:MAG: SRPBCC family protein [Candidatus Dormibacteria bacterium]
MNGNVVTVERTIAAPPAAIFDLIADAGRHPEIDGSGTVKRAQPGAPGRLHLGATFGMAMEMGIKYSMVNTVIEFEESRRIAWQTEPPGVFGRLVGGRIWRYELEPVAGGTLVRESWDTSRDRQRFLLRRFGMPAKTAGNMARTLERIEQMVRSSADGSPATPG